MDIRFELLETARRVQHLLSDDGPQTLVEIQNHLKVKSQLVNFAVGWLAREDRIEISSDKRSFRLHLK